MLAAQLKAVSLTPAWAEAITVLADREPMTIRELGLLLVCEGDHPSRLVHRMVAASLLTSKPSPTDVRARCLTLTPAARNLLPVIRTIENTLHTTIERQFSPAQLNACRAVLGGFVEGLPAGEALSRRRGG